MSECEIDRNSWMLIERVSAIDPLSDGNTDISLVLIGNCAMKDTISISSIQDSLFFTYNYPVVYTIIDTVGWNGEEVLTETTKYYEQTDCNCCYAFNLTLKGYDPSLDYKFIANGTEIPVTEHRFLLKPISFDIFEGDTINYSDIYGFRQGRWVFMNSSRLPFLDAVYLNDEILKGRQWITYDKSNKLTSAEEWSEGRHQADLFYYPSGNLRRRCSVTGKKECADFSDER